MWCPQQGVMSHATASCGVGGAVWVEVNKVSSNPLLLLLLLLLLPLLLPLLLLLLPLMLMLTPAQPTATATSTASDV